MSHSTRTGDHSSTGPRHSVPDAGPCVYVFGKKTTKPKHCTCSMFEPDGDSLDLCVDCGHHLTNHPTTLDSSDPDSDTGNDSMASDTTKAQSHPSMSKYIQTRSSTANSVRDVVAKQLDNRGISYLQGMGSEVVKGLQPTTKQSRNGSGLSRSTFGSSSKALKGTKAQTELSMSTRGKGKDIGKVAGIILNIHGIREDETEANFSAVYNKGTIDYYKKLGLAVVNMCTPIILHLTMNHQQTCTYLKQQFPVLKALRSKSNATEASWAICVRSFSTLTPSPIDFPTASDIYEKRHNDTRGWRDQYCYIVTREPIEKETVHKYCPSSTAQKFNFNWNNLRCIEEWDKVLEGEDSANDEMMDVEAVTKQRGQKRKGQDVGVAERSKSIRTKHGRHFVGKPDDKQSGSDGYDSEPQVTLKGKEPEIIVSDSEETVQFSNTSVSNEDPQDEIMVAQSAMILPSDDNQQELDKDALQETRTEEEREEVEKAEKKRMRCLNPWHPDRSFAF